MSPAEKPWRRILAEGAAILVSILLAFAIQARWDQRQERERVGVILSTLEAAYSENLAMTGVGMETTESSLGVLRRFLSLDASAARQVPPDSAAEMIGNIYRPGRPEPNNDFLLALLDAESLNSLSDSSLREAIARWRSTASSISNRRLQLRWIERDAKRALGRHSVIRPVLVNIFEAPDASSAVLLAALQDDEVMALAVAKAQDWQILMFLFGNLQEQSEAVLEALQRSRGR